MSWSGQQDVRFDITAELAFLAVEISRAYGIWIAFSPLKATVVNAPADGSTGCGESGDPTVLVKPHVPD
ncbi:hypothetical protein [Streptomyces minutiscleroticus]|uniref:Uncharacterized protein n=1 Tax=Streptomyces minutiscleroticus TaxID=68238 RepID=A0A918NMD4_9ACTN|nr:hypothetical protein [Streptomyces minutiscleroticus]GGX80765.1 hypothetical protein GCM10010358_38740 [Streptomyces minutiscleroticus]